MATTKITKSNTKGNALKIIEPTPVSSNWANKFATLAETTDDTRTVKLQFCVKSMAEGPGFEPGLGVQN